MLKIYTIRDSKGEYYTAPFFKNTDAEAIRDFRGLATDDKSTISKNPEDYDLYRLGTFDNQTGHIVPEKSPEHLVKANNINV